MSYNEVEKNKSKLGYELLSNFKFYSNYSKYDEVKGKYESWNDSVDRVFDQMHGIKFKDHLENNLKFKEYYDFAKQKYLEKYVLASQRSLQFGGAPILKHNSKMFNCLTLYCDRPRFFQDTMYWLLSGCGVGFSVQNKHISRLSKIKKRSNRSKVHIVEDSIEGWADAIGILMSSYFDGEVPFPKYQNCHVSFDYSEIRQKGAKISGGFKAPGSEGLRNGIQKIEELIEKELDKPNFNGTLESIVAYDVVMFMADATLSGGVRRCLKDNTLCNSSKGLLQIKNIQIGDEVLTENNTMQKVINKFDNGIQKLWKIKTNLGDFYSTEKHKWGVAKDLYGNIDWIETNKLKLNDSLLFNMNGCDGIYQNFPLNIKYNAPDLDIETAWFFGYFLGNGSVSKRIRLDVSNFGVADNKFRVTMPVNYNGIINKCKNNFGKFITTYFTHNKETSIELSCSKSNITDYFIQFKQPNKTIDIPDFILQNTREIRAAFLAGLLDSDGSVRNELTENKIGMGQISLISTKYYDFARQVQILYSSLGIPTKLQEKARKGKSTEYIIKTISYIFRKKTYETLVNYSIKLKDDYILNDIDKEKNGIYYPKNLASKHGEIRNIWNSNHSCSINRIIDYIGDIPFIPAVVLEVVPDVLEEHVYDIEVENNHSFFADGILSHNSATICLFSLDDEKMLNAKTGKWFIENPQRARSNNSVLLNRNTVTKEQFHSIFQSVKQFGEPGFGFTENEDIIYNPCLSKDSNILTNQGWFKISDLIGKKFTAVVYGNEYDSNDDGFFKTGTKQLYKLITKGGISVKSTDNHMFFICKKESKNIDDYNWTELKHISINDYILLDSNNADNIEYDIVSEITEDIVDDVYDASINDVNCFNANGCISHNCFEIGMKPMTESGVSGSQGCNLVEINGGKCITEKEFYDACKAASIIGTMQATYTDFKYVEPATKEIFERESLLGCSITGFMTNPDILLNPEIQRNGARIVKQINKEVAEMLGIRQAARTTCVKPSGNASVLLSTASGIHGEHSEHYIRNVQANKEDDIAKYFFENNPKMVENSVWSANNTDWVISFPIIANQDSIFKDQLHGIKLLEYVKLTQQNWVEEGTNVELCTDPTLRHNVSNTVVVDDWDEVEDYIFENRKYFAGVSLLPMTGDKDYNQAPFTSILMPEQLLKKYGESVFFVSGLIVDSLSAFNNNLWLACDTILGNGEKLEYTEKEVEEKIKFTTPRELWEKLGFKNGTLEKLSSLHIKPEAEEYKRYMDSKLNSNIHNYVLKKDWVRRAKQFAERYFTSDKEMVYCLKDVHNYHKWVEITREINDIDWDNLSIKPKYTDIDTLGAVACSGGACEV